MNKTTLALSLAASLFLSPAFADNNDRNTASIPRFDHVFLIMMENHSYGQIIGDSVNAPYINQLANSANLATNYMGVGHPSLTNYLEVVGGSNFGIENDNSPNWHNATPSPSLIDPIAGSGMDLATPAVDTTNNGTPAAPIYNVPFDAAPYVARTIADQLADANMSWKTYQESLPASGTVDQVNYSDGIYSNLSPADIVNSGNVQKLYAVKHNPFVYFENIQQNADPKNGLGNVVDFEGINGLYADLRSDDVPNFLFIAPNQCHDMHGVGNGSAFCAYDPNPPTQMNPTLIQMGDATVKQLVMAIKSSEAWKHGKNALIVMWDENDYSSNPNQVAMIVDTNYGVHGVKTNKPYNHFSLLKTLESGFGLDCLNHACDKNVQVMSDMFSTRPAR